ncbi:MAG: M15 family metallopeptidase [Cyclobacteriaceae bacterium]|nr:M15 family metallopeptidase [Cyclobacteriaceae bacterium]
MKSVIVFFAAFIFSVSLLHGQDVDKNYLLGKFNQNQDERFVQLDDQYTRGSARGAYLRKETYEAFVKMAEAAKVDGVTLVIISATRNYLQQKAIWERKWTADTESKSDVDRAKKILLYSSMPGSSRHHWGTDMDLNNLNNEYFDSGEGLKIYEWLKAHGHEYGFCQPYTAKTDGRTGYEEERWHWSYTPLSIPFLEAYKNTVTHSDIKDFLGSDTAAKIDIIANYVDGVSCK